MKTKPNMDGKKKVQATDAVSVPPENEVARAVLSAKKAGVTLPMIIEAFLAGVMIAYPEDRVAIKVTPSRSPRRAAG